MGEIVTILLLCSGALSGALYRNAHRRQERARFTREWIEFLQEDLTVGAL